MTALSWKEAQPLDGFVDFYVVLEKNDLVAYMDSTDLTGVVPSRSCPLPTTYFLSRF